MAEERTNVSEKVCSKCGRTYRGHPAISRVDNVTPICQLCGTREALDSLGISDEEKEKILRAIPTVEDK